MNDTDRKKNGADEALHGGLISEHEAGLTSDSFARELEETLQQTEQAVKRLGALRFAGDPAASWHNARRVIEDFKPVPWFIWRLTNFVFAKSGYIAPISDGMVLGLKRLIVAAAGDKTLGTGQPINSVRQALKIVPSDVIAAVSVIHAVCRRLANREHERIWRPILDDAVLRSHLGYYVGQAKSGFGAGRGMLAGFAGRCGLAVLISGGDLDQARQALEMLAGGMDISQVGASLYDCDPLQVGAMTLSASGCGRDAALGTVAFAVPNSQSAVEGEAQLEWLSAFTICERARVGQLQSVETVYWSTLGLTSEENRQSFEELVTMLIRKGHGWDWMVK